MSVTSSGGDTILEPTDDDVSSIPTVASESPKTAALPATASTPVATPRADASEEFVDTDSTVEALTVGGKVVATGDSAPPAQAASGNDAVSNLTPVASATVIGAVQVPPQTPGEKEYTACKTIFSMLIALASR